jgi:hypothetical protein
MEVTGIGSSPWSSGSTTTDLGGVSKAGNRILGLSRFCTGLHVVITPSATPARLKLLKRFHCFAGSSLGAM